MCSLNRFYQVNEVIEASVNVEERMFDLWEGIERGNWVFEIE